MQGVDVVVATPGRIQELLARNSLRLDRCRAIVLDEVDVLLGEWLSGSYGPRIPSFATYVS